MTHVTYAALLHELSHCFDSLCVCEKWRFNILANKQYDLLASHLLNTVNIDLYTDLYIDLHIFLTLSYLLQKLFWHSTTIKPCANSAC